MCQSGLESSSCSSLQDALTLVRQLIHPERLSTIQESVFAYCWSGQTYQEIADQMDYDGIYIRGIGSQLWQQLTKVFGEKVTKGNFKVIIEQCVGEQKRANISGIVRPFSGQNSDVLDNSTVNAGQSQTFCSTDTYYIERPVLESRCYNAIIQQGALIRIKAPRQMGKTSLMAKILSHAKQHQHDTVIVSLRLADGDTFESLDRFLKWFCAILCDQLGIDEDLNRHWKPILGSNYNCTQFFYRILLPQLASSVVIALDDVDVLFQYSAIATDFLGLLRAWCEKAKHSDPSTDPWHRLKLLVIHSTEVYIPINQNQSPFNIGLSIELPEFTPEQLLELSQRYQVSWTLEEVMALMALVGGKPNLIRLTLDWIASQETSLKNILANATAANGIYYEHLRQQFRLIQKYPDMVPLLQQVMNSERAITFPSTQGFQLESLGLVKLEGQEVSPSCELYRQYFGPLLSNF